TSPTNIGLYLLSTVVARDMAWISQDAALTRLEQTLATMGRMARMRGHFYNWYNTRDLAVLHPDYISSVDSGNLAGHLIAVAQACETPAPTSADLQHQAVIDALRLARQSADKTDELDAVIAELTDSALSFDSIDAKLASLQPHANSDVDYWIKAARQASLTSTRNDLKMRGNVVAKLCRQFAMEMEFGFLIDPAKKLLSIGYSVSSNTLDPSCYDLLASEARLASLFAIAKGDVATRHWFRLGRTATPIGAGSALISWSGSMFEYLMPTLVMHEPVGSILEQTNRLIVQSQRSYGTKNGIPWGVSESSYNARDLEMTYQYSNFGVPGLGLKRGLSQNQVIAPYASGLASMIDAPAAAANYARLAKLGAEGRYGFYEAVDFTATRVPANSDHAIVQSFMAHHQGMTITAIANVVLDGRLRDWFHAEPIIQSVALLLQERVPRDASTNRPQAEKVAESPLEDGNAPALRRFDDPLNATPTGHILSNPRYSLTLTPNGAGHSQWHDMAITRRRDDPSRDAVGTFVFLRDTGDDSRWSATVAPMPGESGRGGAANSAVFCEHHAEFVHRGPRLITKTEVVVSPEDDAEARRVTLTNTSRHERIIDVTSYAELALAPAAADLAHPVFSKMFVVTDYMEELGVLMATRRKRTPTEPEVWAAHIAVVEGEETAPLQYETDRARFIGRGHTLENATALGGQLSGSTGTVLDPIFALRRQVKVPVGGSVQVTFWTLVAETPDALLTLVERHRDPSGFARALTLAWTQTQVQLRHLDITHTEARDFQRLSGMIQRGDARLRASPARIIAGAGLQSALWSAGISGDLPILLVRIDDVHDIAQVQEALVAHEYWNMRHFPVDLVLLNEHASSYVQDLQQALDSAVRAAQLRPTPPRGTDRNAKGKIYVLRSDLITAETRALLMSLA
ncbi:MAG: glucoamylase family protein, partial [Deltaproteobacteria bacterium]